VTKFIAQEFSYVNVVSFQSSWDKDGLEVRERGISDPGANQSQLVTFTIFNEIFLPCLEGPMTPINWSYIGNFLFYLDCNTCSVFFYIFLYIIYWLLRYKKSHGALAMVKTKPKIQNKLTKETTGTKNSSTGVRTSPRPTYGHEIQPSKSRETLPKPADSMKNKSINLAFLRRHKVTKGNYIRRTGRNRGDRG